MPSLDDIPNHILDTLDAQLLTKWLEGTATDWATRSTLISKWSQFTKTGLRQSELKRLRETAIDFHGSQK